MRTAFRRPRQAPQTPPQRETGIFLGKSEYLIPEITIFDIAVERGFAESAQLSDVGYDDSWESANQ